MKDHGKTMLADHSAAGTSVDPVASSSADLTEFSVDPSPLAPDRAGATSRWFSAGMSIFVTPSFHKAPVDHRWGAGTSNLVCRNH